MEPIRQLGGVAMYMCTQESKAAQGQIRGSLGQSGIQFTWTLSVVRQRLLLCDVIEAVL